MHAQLVSMHRQHAEMIGTCSRLEKEFAKYKALGPPLTEGPSPLTEALKQQICQEYKKSSELSKEVMQQFEDGYQSAHDKDKERMQVTSFDRSILDSSDDEADT